MFVCSQEKNKERVVFETQVEGRGGGARPPVVILIKLVLRLVRFACGSHVPLPARAGPSAALLSAWRRSRCAL